MEGSATSVLRSERKCPSELMKHNPRSNAENVGEKGQTVVSKIDQNQNYVER